MTNNSPWINPSDFWDEDLMHLAVIPQGHFQTEASFGYSGQNFNITANEDLMSQDHLWTEAPFGYSGQNVEIFYTTANESINIQNILIEEMHDPILQIKNSLQDPWKKCENDMQKIIQELKEKLFKWES